MTVEHPLVMPTSVRLAFFNEVRCRHAAWQRRGRKGISRRFEMRVHRHKRCTAHISQAWPYGLPDMWR